MQLLKRGVLLILLVWLPACGEEGFTPQDAPIDPDLEIQIGWAHFRSREYVEALARFSRLVREIPDAADGHIGAGWCRLELDSLEAAIVSLSTATLLSDNADGYAGLAVAASALGQDELAVTAAEAVVDETYVFLGDPTFTYTDLVYIRALGQFHLLRWEDCYRSLLILWPDLEIDLSAFDFRDRLFAALEQLRGRT
jgi:tetratricopeptide (TPR) repeat protein